MISKEFYRTAIHEAGHACASWTEGCRLVHTKINESGEGETLTTHPVHKILHTIDWKNGTLKSFLNCLLVGPAAELFSDGKMGREFPPHLDDDVLTAWQYVKSRGWRAPPDFTCADFFVYWGGPARLFVVSYNREIRLLANKLILQKKMSGQEVAIFLESIFKTMPLKALKHDQHKG